MKSTIRLSLALLCLIFSSSPGICQSVLEETFQIKDAEGKDYTLEELRVSNGLASLNTEDNCSDNSYFNLFFEQGSGFEDYANNPVHAERAEVLCQVFSDLSTFIQPLIDNPEINILVRAFEGNPSSYAGASALYFVPSPNQNNSVSMGHVQKLGIRNKILTLLSKSNDEHRSKFVVTVIASRSIGVF